MTGILSDKDLDIIFREARSYNSWSEDAVSDVSMQAVYDLMRWGPTSANCFPARFFFLKSAAAKERLKPHLTAGNKEKVMTAPFTVIIGYDTEYYEKIPELFPHKPDAKSWFTGSPEVTKEHALRNSSLQGAYLILAARALGFDCGPMSGFDQEGVNQAFFPAGNIRVNFLCAIGHGTREKLFPRGPRPSFEDVCEIL